ncbi:MAG: DUF2238 domain-containing protein [Pirellulales bacterium]
MNQPRRWSAGIAVIVGLTAVYVAAAAVGAIVTGNLEFVFYIAVMLVLIGLVGLVHWHVGLSTGLLAALSLWGLMHMAGGLVPVPESWPIDGKIRVLYSWWIIPGRLKYDQIVHAYGFGVTTCVAWEALRASIARRMEIEPRRLMPTVPWLLLCAIAGMGFGALNEVVEFAATLLMAETNVGGYENTGWDLVSNGIGCAIAAAGLWIVGKRQAAIDDDVTAQRS